MGGVEWRHDGLSVQPQWKWESYQEDTARGGGNDHQGATPFSHGHELPLLFEHRLQHGNERHFLVHLRIAQRDGSLSGENLEDLQMGRGKEIRVRTFQAKVAARPLASVRRIA